MAPKPVKLKLHIPGKEPWYKALMRKVGLGKPNKEVTVTPTVPSEAPTLDPASTIVPAAAPEAATAVVAAAASDVTPVTPPAAPEPVAPAAPKPAAPGIASIDEVVAGQPAHAGQPAEPAAPIEPASSVPAPPPAAAQAPYVVAPVEPPPAAPVEPIAPVVAPIPPAVAEAVEPVVAAQPAPAVPAIPPRAPAAAAPAAATPAEAVTAPPDTVDEDADAKVLGTAAAAAAAAAAADEVLHPGQPSKAKKRLLGKKVKPAKKPKAAKPAKPGKSSEVDKRLGKTGAGPRPKRDLSTITSWVTDPRKRPRTIIWAGVTLSGLFIVTAVALGVTSSYWFCANGCHKVQDDTIIAYNRSAHSKISCMACHMPVGADPATFMVHKVKALGELYMTISDTFELPLNPEDAVAKEMPADQCTQCHTSGRKTTPSKGITIDHKVHAAKGITCTTCHNRVAHVEDFKLTLAGNRKHEDWMTMEACFRCHSVTRTGAGPGGYYAPGECSVCHPKDFLLKPANHRVGDDFTKSHPEVVKTKGKAYCLMCHNEKTFCYGCHGTQIPHPANFQKNHGLEFKAAQAKDPNHIQLCLNCHGAKGLGGTEFCNNCHHKGANPAVPWVQQHPEFVKSKGTTYCLTGCHGPTFCAKCHTRLATAP